MYCGINGGRTFERKATTSVKKGGGRIFEGGLIFGRLRYVQGAFPGFFSHAWVALASVLGTNFPSLAVRSRAGRAWERGLGAG